jgi:hypothetical protein
MKGERTMQKICEVYWRMLIDGRIELTFVNHSTGATEKRVYKTASAAKAQETRFYNRAARIYPI